MKKKRMPDFSIGEKVAYSKKGALGWESVDEADQANLIFGRVVTIEKFDTEDYSVKIKESVCDTWISGLHFIHSERGFTITKINN